MTEAVSRERSSNYLRQIKGTVAYRTVSIAASFLSIPLMINYLGQEQFGVWSTLLSVMSWVLFFDLGIGNGLRNKVAESLARGETREAASFVASAYTIIGFIALSILITFNISAYFISWQAVFNTKVTTESTLRETVQIAVLFVVLNFWTGLITSILSAVQRISLVALGQLISNLLILAFVFFLSKFTQSSIQFLALVYGSSLLTTNILLSLWFFYQSHPDLRPRIDFEKSHIRPLLTVGLQFFAIQLAGLIIFTSDKILITQLFGPQQVTQYEVIFKLFSIITVAHGVISAPLWSAYTDAYHRNDFNWIRRILTKQLFIFGIVVTATFILIITARSIIQLWISNEFLVSFQLIIMLGIFTMLSVWNNIFATIVNGLGKIKIQLYTAIIASIINIPLSIFFSKYAEFGLSGVIIGSIISLLIAAIALPLQVNNLIKVKYKKTMGALY